MIVRHFLRWVQTAPAGDRADATAALARAYLHADLSSEDLAAAEAALVTLLDDPSPLVRLALADTLAHAEHAPESVIVGLLQDRSDIAAIVAGRSPLLLDAELVDLVGAGDEAMQVAVAGREALPTPVAAAVAEVGCLDACRALLRRPALTLPNFSLDRIVERFGADGDIRAALLARPDLSAPTRQALVLKLGEALAGFVADRSWIAPDRARRISVEAAEKATIAIACEAGDLERRALMKRLRVTGQLTTGLVLRALLCGQVTMFEDALGELSGLAPARVAGLVHDRRGAGFRALYDKAKLPTAAYPAFCAALDAFHDGATFHERAGGADLRRRMVERVLTAYAPLASSDMDQLLAVLRRFAAEAMRDEARAFAADLIAGQSAVADEDMAFPAAAAA